MATKAEIATKVLQKLQVLKAGGTADPGDSTLVQDKYDTVYQLLHADDLVSWASTEDIPVEAVTAIVGLVARECLEEFVVPPLTAQFLIQGEQRYKDQLRMLEYQYYVPTTNAEYF